MFVHLSKNFQLCLRNQAIYNETVLDLAIKFFTYAKHLLLVDQ